MRGLEDIEHNMNLMDLLPWCCWGWAWRGWTAGVPVERTIAGMGVGGECVWKEDKYGVFRMILGV